jgi:hypothetical protein
MVAFIGCQSANQNTTTNQKQAAATEGSMEGMFDEWDAWGKRDAIIFGDVVSWIGGKNIK